MHTLSRIDSTQDICAFVSQARQSFAAKRTLAQQKDYVTSMRKLSICSEMMLRVAP